MKYSLINSKENALVKQIVKLTTDTSHRSESLLSVVFGLHLIEESLKFNRLTTVIILDTMVHKYETLLKNINKNSQKISIYIANKDILNKINILDGMCDIVGVINVSYCDNHNNILKDDCIILENIQDPGNLGVILRTVSAAGIHHIGLSTGCVDAYHPKVLRASQGLQFTLNIYQNLDINQFISNYTGQIIATTTKADNLLYNIDFKHKTALVFGNEGYGITHAILSQIQSQVQIPIADSVESLNLATAVAISTFELARQRLKY